MAPLASKKRKLSHSSESDDEDLSADSKSLEAQQPNGPANGASSSGNKYINGSSYIAARGSRSTQATTDELLLSQSSHKSSLLKLQLDELLTAVRPDFPKLTERVKSTLGRIKEIIEAIPRGTQRSLAEAEKDFKKNGIVIPFPDPQPSKDIKYRFEYLPPADINVVGNFALKLGTKPAGLYDIDLAITLSPETFQEKDYLNHRYFHKRAFCIATIAAAIRSAGKSDFNLAFEWQDDVKLQTCLVITPGKTASADFTKSNCRIRVITAIASDIFSLEKTSISRNCIRPKGLEDEPNISPQPTPFYNSCLRAEASVTPYLKVLSKACSNCEGFRNASLLAATWLKQRGYGSRIADGGFGTFEFAVVCAILLEGGGPKNHPILSPRYNSHQLFKGVLQFLVGRDLLKPLVVGPHSSPILNGSRPVLYDAYRGVNVLNKMSPWAYDMLRYDAKTTLDALNAKLYNNFEPAFISKVDEPLLRFDQMAVIDLGTVLADQPSHQLYDNLYETLKRGLGDRAPLIYLQTPSSKPWALNKSDSRSSVSNNAVIGFLLNSDTANRLVDRGPLAEEKEAAEAFRKFWGEKAELRRFNDGAISESLIWSGTDGRSVVEQIMVTLLPLHLGLPPSAISICADRVDRTLGIQDSQKSFQALIETFQSFSSKLHSLEGLPLNIRLLSSTDESLRFSSLSDPIKSFHANNIIVQFEGSARWPDALTAIQRTKIAFLTKLGDLLESSDEPMSARIGLENTQSNLLNVAFLDVFLQSGIIFRLRIHHEREQVLLERQLKDKELHGRDRDEAAQALITYKRDYVQSPRHTHAIRSLCTRFPALSSTIRLLKKWISSHFLTPFFSSELLELLSAYVFLRPQPWTAPSTPTTAFLRVLVVLSKWDWPADPLILDLSSGTTTEGSASSSSNGDLTLDTIATMTTNFAAWRKLDPAMNTVALSVATNLDPTGVIWTQGSRPPKVVATRLTTLARAAVDSIRDQGLSLDIRTLFSSPLTHFDFLIHIKPSVVSRFSSSSSTPTTTPFKNLTLDTTHSVSDPSAADANAIALYINDLAAAFDPSIVLFFYDGSRHGGVVDVVAGLWNPRTVSEGARDFRVRMGVSTRPCVDDDDEEEGEEGKGEGKEGKVEVNKDGMLAEMAMLGHGIVDRIHVLEKS